MSPAQKHALALALWKTDPSLPCPCLLRPMVEEIMTAVRIVAKSRLRSPTPPIMLLNKDGTEEAMPQ